MKLPDRCFRKFCTHRKVIGAVLYDDGRRPAEWLGYCRKHQEYVTRFAEQRRRGRERR